MIEINYVHVEESGDVTATENGVRVDMLPHKHQKPDEAPSPLAVLEAAERIAVDHGRYMLAKDLRQLRESL